MGLFLKDWFEKASVGWGRGEGGGEILCRDLNGVTGSGEECLGRGNSKLKERLLMMADLGVIEDQEGSQFGWP